MRVAPFRAYLQRQALKTTLLRRNAIFDQRLMQSSELA
jgi:hypothetical protein